MLFFTLSRLKGTTEDPLYYQMLRHNSVRGQYHYCGYHIRVPEQYVGGSLESKFTAAVSHYSFISIPVMLIAGHPIITPEWESEQRVDGQSYFVHSFFCPLFPPAPSQCCVTGESTLLSASGGQGVGVEVCEVYKNSLKQKADFLLVYILKFLLFVYLEIHDEMQHTRHFH